MGAMTASQPTPSPQYAPITPTPKGLAITALVVGIIAFLTGLVPVLGFILGAVAVVFGIIALVKKQSKGMAITGLALGAVALITSLIVTVTVGVFTSEVSKNIDALELIEELPAEESTEAEADEEPEAEPEPAPEPQEPLTLDEGWVTEMDEFGAYTVIKGQVSNNTDEAITNYVQITFDALDADGANIGTCLDNANTIDANGKWKFEAACIGITGDIDTIRFKEISGF